MSLLEIKNLTKKFKGVTAVNNLSFNVQEGEILGLIGPNGAGKSTVFDMMSGIRPPDGSSPLPDNGAIVFSGQDIVGMQPFEICKTGISRTFQISKIIAEMTVTENIYVAALFGKKRKAYQINIGEETEQICSLLELTDKTNVLAANLTIVERKRLELARALSTKPKLLLLDEVMAGLRPTEIDKVCDMIQVIKTWGISMVVVEHVMKAIMRISDRIVVMDSGEKIAEGNPEHIANNPIVIKAYLGKEEE